MHGCQMCLQWTRSIFNAWIWKSIVGPFLRISIHPIYNTMIAYGIAKLLEAGFWNGMKKQKEVLTHLYALEEELHLSAWSEVILPWAESDLWTAGVFRALICAITTRSSPFLAIWRQLFLVRTVASLETALEHVVLVDRYKTLLKAVLLLPAHSGHPSLPPFLLVRHRQIIPHLKSSPR